MIIKATLMTLILILVVVISASYYVNKEGFDDITASVIGTQPIPATGTPTVAPIPASGTPTVAPIPASGTPTVAPSPATGTPSVAPIPASASTPQRVDIIPEISISGTGYDAMTLQQRMDLLQKIQKDVRNEIIANRNTKPIISGETRQPTPSSDSTAQGQEYESSCYKDTEYRCPKNPDGTCPPMPDMSQYIKKDAIPCWGCSLDY
jgi:hypothetical protein